MKQALERILQPKHSFVVTDERMLDELQVHDERILPCSQRTLKMARSKSI
jgi:hypothetical protein